MILKTQNTQKDLQRLDLITISFVIAYFGALLYPHKAIAGGALIDGKTVIEILLFSSFTLFVTARLASKDPILERSILSRPLAVLTILILFSSLFAQNKPIALEAIFLYLAYICCFFIFLALFQQTNKQISIVYIIVFIALFLSLYGLLQYNTMNPPSRLTSVWRLRASFSNSNLMAGFLSMTIPLCVGLLFTGDLPKLAITGLCFTIVVMLTALLFTYARSSWIATSIGIGCILAVYFLPRKHLLTRVVPIVLSILLVIGLVFLSSANLVNRFNTMTQKGTDSSLFQRTVVWKGTIEMIKANPVHGVGPGNYSKAFRTFQPPGLSKLYVFAHNDYLQFISETGVLLIPIIIGMFILLCRHSLQKIHQGSPRIRGITLGAMGGIIALLVYSLSDFNLHIPANALLFTILAAIVVSPVSTEKDIVIST